MLHYLISDPHYYGNQPKDLSQNLINILNNTKVDMLCFRDKESSNFKVLAQAFIDTAKKFSNKKVLINNNIKLAKELGFDGVHLTSKQFLEIEQAKKLNLFVVISCHNEIEINLAINYKADMVTYSPIFHTPNKGEPKGIENLKKIIKDYDIPLIALGGIVNEEHINLIKATNIAGFGSIRYFIS